MKKPQKKHRVLILFLLFFILLVAFTSCAPTNNKRSYSGYYGGYSGDGKFLFLEIMPEGKIETNLSGMNVEGSYTIQAQTLTLKYNYQGTERKTVGKITEDVVQFQDAVLIHGFSSEREADSSFGVLNFGANDSFYNHVMNEQSNLLYLNSFLVKLTDKVAYLSDGGGRKWWKPKNVLIVPAEIEYQKKKYRTALYSFDKSDMIKNSNAHTLIIDDGVKINGLFGYGNNNLRAICLPDDTNGVTACTIQDSMLSSLAKEYPELVFYVVEGSSAHQCCETLHLNYCFRPDYKSSGLRITQDLSESDPAILTYIELLQQTAPTRGSKSHAIRQIEPDALKAAPKIYPYIDGSRWGYFDEMGNVAVPPTYDYAGECINGLCVVEKDGFYGIISSVGEEVVPCEFLSITDGESGVFGADAGGNVAILNVAEGTVRYIDADEIYPFYRGYAIITKGGKSGIVDKEGRITIEPQYDYVQLLQGGRGVASNRTETGYEIELFSLQGKLISQTKDGRFSSLDGSVVVCNKGDIYDGNLSTEVYYASGNYTTTKDEMILYNGAVGYWTTEGRHYSYDEAKDLGLKNGKDGRWYQIDFFYPTKKGGLTTIKSENYSGGLVKRVQFFQNGVAILEAKDEVLFPLLPYNTHKYEYYNTAIDLQQNEGISFLSLSPASADGIVLAEIRVDGEKPHLGFAWLQIHNPLVQESWTVFMPNNNETLSNKEQEDEIVCMSAFQNGYATIYNRKGKAGLVDMNGNIVMAPMFDMILVYPNYVVGIDVDSYTSGYHNDTPQNMVIRLKEGSEWYGIHSFDKKEIVSGKSHLITFDEISNYVKK